jgi:hypothetical protein
MLWRQIKQILNNETVSTFQLVVASVAKEFLKGSTNDSPAFEQLSVSFDSPAFEQLPVPHDSPTFEHLPVPNGTRAITTLSFLHLHVPFRMIGFYHSTKIMVNSDLHPSLLRPILLIMNRVYKDGQAIMANVTISLLLLPASNGRAITMTNTSLLLPFYWNESAIMMVTQASILLLPVWDSPTITMATHTTHANLLLLPVWDGPEITVAIHANFTLQLIVVSTPRALIKLIVDFILASEGALTFSDILSDSLLNDLIVSFVSPSKLIVKFISTPKSLFLLCNKDNSKVMTPSLLLFCVKDSPVIMMAPLANFSLQFIVESISKGEQFAPNFDQPGEVNSSNLIVIFAKSPSTSVKIAEYFVRENTR